MSRPAAFRVAVIGGGVNGLATAWHLGTRDEKHVALIERYRVGHDRGSSHGAGRITRSSYGDALYVRLMREANTEAWPRLERDADEPLIQRCDGAFFGPPGGEFESYARAVIEGGADVERLDPSEGRRRFPAFAFPDAAGVLHDRTAGVIAAERTLRAFARRAIVHGVHVLDDTQVLALELDRDPIAVVTNRGTVLAERVIVTAGAWVRALLPSLAHRFTVCRQHVAYFRLDAPPEAVRPGAFPVWVYLGETPPSLHYGLPEFGVPGVKAARHGTSGTSDDPDGPRDPDPRTLAEVEAFLRRQLAVRIEERVHAETCLYTNTADEDFVLGPLADDPRVVVGSACSGHGFKFAPLTGRILAELALDGRTRVAEFERARARFAPERVANDAGA